MPVLLSIIKPKTREKKRHVYASFLLSDVDSPLLFPSFAEVTKPGPIPQNHNLPYSDLDPQAMILCVFVAQLCLQMAPHGFHRFGELGRGLCLVLKKAKKTEEEELHRTQVQILQNGPVPFTSQHSDVTERPGEAYLFSLYLNQ